MVERKQTRRLVLFVAMWLILLTAPSALGQSGEFRIDYTVTIADLQKQLFHVTADVKNIREPHMDISLPTWTPGWYTIENYAKNILRFTITDDKGTRLLYTMPRKQTWRVETKGLNRIKVDFDYRADILALNQAKIASDFAFFTGTELFVMAEGHRSGSSAVRFEVPAGWKIVSALKETADPKTFTASDYDTLVDAPTQMGSFDVTKFEVEGKPHYFLSTPAGKFPKDKAEKFAELLASAARSQSAIFGGLPYDKYVYFYFFLRPESNAGGALEHQNSHVAFPPPPELTTPDMIIRTAAHEFFHTWNVKRIRPKEMWPYDYSRENETPLLWVSEGFTNYYGDISLYRAGVIARDQFLHSVEDAISEVEGNEARKYISPANSSSSTWLGYDTPVAFGISYYTQGQNLAALLDLSMLHDTAGKYGLDDVMRALYRDYYQKGKGFSTEDLISIINSLTKRSYNDFYRRYVWGVEVPPYDTILGYAGYKLEGMTAPKPQLGVEGSVAPTGGIQVTRVIPDTPAVKAGFQVGDLLVSYDGIEVRRGFGAVNRHLLQKLGQSVKVIITREGEDKTLELQVIEREQQAYKIIEAPRPTPDQLKLRERWLRMNNQ
jgi:predicted metalloprotease with PDZ domain